MTRLPGSRMTREAMRFSKSLRGTRFTASAKHCRRLTRAHQRQARSTAGVYPCHRDGAGQIGNPFRFCKSHPRGGNSDAPECPARRRTQRPGRSRSPNQRIRRALAGKAARAPITIACERMRFWPPDNFNLAPLPAQQSNPEATFHPANPSLDLNEAVRDLPAKHGMKNAPRSAS
jgi:hypothetical protein